MDKFPFSPLSSCQEKLFIRLAGLLLLFFEVNNDENTENDYRHKGGKVNKRDDKSNFDLLANPKELGNDSVSGN